MRSDSRGHPGSIRPTPMMIDRNSLVVTAFERSSAVAVSTADTRKWSQVSHRLSTGATGSPTGRRLIAAIQLLLHLVWPLCCCTLKVLSRAAEYFRVPRRMIRCGTAGIVGTCPSRIELGREWRWICGCVVTDREAEHSGWATIASAKRLRDGAHKFRLVGMWSRATSAKLGS